MIPSLKTFSKKEKDSLKVWLWSCPHEDFDNDRGNFGIRDSINQVKGSNGFDFDFSICNGDFDGNQQFPTLTGESIVNGENLVSYLSEFPYSRNNLYVLAGNHDCGDGNVDWFLRYLDPLGDNTNFSGVDKDERPYPITLMYDNDERGKSWHSYYIEVGKYIFILLSDRNELPYPYGRGGSPELGGHPSGTITRESWEWTKEIILKNKNKNIFISTHENPKDTTIGTGDNDGVNGSYHGTSGQGIGTGNIYNIYNESNDTVVIGSNEILDFFNNNPNHTVVMWSAGHTHTDINEIYNNKGNSVLKNDVLFLNVGHINEFFVNDPPYPRKEPHSYLMELDGSNIKLTQYLHQVAGTKPIGFNNDNIISIKLKV